LHRHLNRPPADVARVVARSERVGLVQRSGEYLKLTPAGRRRATEALNVV
jgi:hypothetical protein